MKLPDAVKNSSVREDANVDVWYDETVNVTLPFIGKEQIGHPHFLGIRQR